MRKTYPEEWASELHVDGSLISGVWKFPPNSPQERDSAEGVGVADFYARLFQDFAYLATEVYEAAGYSAKLYATCTMHLADRLPLVSAHGQISAPASRRPSLRWPIATVDSADMSATGEDMAAQFLRIYGRKFQK